MERHQQRRFQFVESNPGFKETKTPLGMWRKFFQETGEAVHAFFVYVRQPTRENQHHLGEELADIAFILLDMASFAGINLNEAIEKKLSKDEGRFPPGTVMKMSDYRRRKVHLGERRR